MNRTRFQQWMLGLLFVSGAYCLVYAGQPVLPRGNKMFNGAMVGPTGGRL